MYGDLRGNRNGRRGASSLIAGDLEALVSLGFVAANPALADGMLAATAAVAAYYAFVC